MKWIKRLINQHINKQINKQINKHKYKKWYKKRQIEELKKLERIEVINNWNRCIKKLNEAKRG